MLQVSDLIIISLKDNEDDSNKLSRELNLLGVRTASYEIKNITTIENVIDEILSRSSSGIFLVNTDVINSISSKKIKFNSLNKKFIFTFFCTQKSGREKFIINELNQYVTKSRSFESLAIEIITEVLSKKFRKIEFYPDNRISNIWFSPLYIFKKSKEYDTEVKILVDVTWSSKPTRPELAPTFLNALRKTITLIGKDSCKVVDIGAGKLRYSVFLLEKGHSVTAVDFESIYTKPSEQIQDYINKAETYSSFNQVVYPSELVEHEAKHDLAILINVLGIMPEPIERLFVLTQCNKILEKNGYVLLFNQHGDKDQIAAASDKITDGGCTTSKGIKTFYKDYNTQEELILLFSLAGFEIIKNIDFEPSSSHILLFKKSKEPFLNIIDLVEKKRPITGREIFIGQTSSEIALADIIDSDNCLKFGGILLFFLSELNPGNDDSHKYEVIIKLIIRYIFNKNFKSHLITEQYEIDQGRKRIDLKAKWRQNSELKNILVENHGLKTSFIPIECKNYSKLLKNSEYSQIIDRCNKRHRHFGIIFCRETKDRNKVIKHCHDRWESHEYLIIVIDDNDLEKLLKHRDQDKQDEIIEFIENRIEEVRDNITS